MQEKWIIWGTGHIGKRLYDYLEERECTDNVIAVVDSDKNKQGMSWNGHKIQSPDIIEREHFDKLIIAVASWKPINQFIIKKYGILQESIENYMFLQKKDMLEMYKQEKQKNDELERHLELIRQHPMDVFVGSFTDKYVDMKVEVYHDEEKEMFYVFHCGKKMYFPRKFTEKEVINYYRQIAMEQDILSPHRYQSNNFFVEEREVILDAGAAEGNFSLEVIDKAKSIYLVESDEAWIEALKNTFEPYKDKVHIIQKYLTDKSGEGCVTIDELAQKEVFTSVKMDIEGTEVEALKGAEETFLRHSVKAFVCSYHRESDYEEIYKIFRDYGYCVSTTDGYMAFSVCKAWETKTTPRLVRGIIRARKEIDFAADGKKA